MDEKGNNKTKKTINEGMGKGRSGLITWFCFASSTRKHRHVAANYIRFAHGGYFNISLVRVD